jgi:hypothetical protein
MKSGAGEGSRNTQFEIERWVWQANAVSFESAFEDYGAVAFGKDDTCSGICQF